MFHELCRTISCGIDKRFPERQLLPIAAGMLDFFGKYDSEKYSSGGAPLHDPCTVAWLLKPDLFKLKSCHVAVETMSELTMGHTAVDFWQITGQKPNVEWAYDVDAEAFFQLLSERLSLY